MTGQVPGRFSRRNTHYGDEDDVKLHCESCRLQDGRHVTATGFCQDCIEYLCEDCYKTHTSRVGSHHKLLDSSQMPKISPPHNTSKREVAVCTLICPNHPSSVIEFHCPTHGASVCLTCAVTRHKPCHVVHITDIAGDFKQSETYKDVIDDLEKLDRRVDVYQDRVEYIHKESRRSSYSAIDEFRIFKRGVIDYLEKKETEMMQVTRAMADKDINNNKKRRSSADAMKAKLYQMKLGIKLNESNSSDLFVSSHQARDKMSDLRDTLAKCEIDNTGDIYTFTPGQTWVDMISSNCGLGQIQRIDTAEWNEDASNSAGTRISRLQTVPANMQDDSVDCFITGSTLVTPSRLLLADNNNKCVKSVDTMTNTVTSFMPLPSKPWDITTLVNGQAAVTLPSVKRIQIIDIEDGLVPVHSVKVDGHCRGIAASRVSLKLMVSYVRPGKIEVMGYNGGVLQIIDTAPNDGVPLFKMPMYVAVSVENYKSEIIHVSDNHTHTITDLSIDGQVLCRYKDPRLIHPTGLAVIDNENLLVSNWYGSSVQLITQNGEKVPTHKVASCGEADEVNFEIDCPLTVSYCPVKKTVYVTSDSDAMLFKQNVLQT